MIDEYTFSPLGTFGYTSFDGGYSFQTTDFNLDKCKIIPLGETNQRLVIGDVQQCGEWTRAYVWEEEEGVPLSIFRSSLFSSGSFFDRLKQFEVFDENNTLIGFVEGSWDLHNAAYFSFYTTNRELLATAILDSSYSNMVLYGPDKTRLFEAEKILRASYYLHNPEYYWNVKKLNDTPFDTRFLWPFMAFLSEVWWNS